MVLSKTRAAVFAALGDPLRLRVADELALSDRTPGELIDIVGVSSALLAHHLDVLETAGVIERTVSHADARKRFVRLMGIHRNLFIVPSEIPAVVFVCTQNSARSQLAAGIWQQFTGKPTESAGTQPATTIDPMATMIARRHRLPMATRRPRQFEKHKLQNRTIITVCDQAHDELEDPLDRLHWSIQDPVTIGTQRAFERTYDELVERILSLTTINEQKGKQK